MFSYIFMPSEKPKSVDQLQPGMQATIRIGPEGSKPITLEVFSRGGQAVILRWDEHTLYKVALNPEHVEAVVAEHDAIRQIQDNSGSDDFVQLAPITFENGNQTALLPCSFPGITPPGVQHAGMFMRLIPGFEDARECEFRDANEILEFADEVGQLIHEQQRAGIVRIDVSDRNIGRRDVAGQPKKRVTFLDYGSYTRRFMTETGEVIETRPIVGDDETLALTPLYAHPEEALRIYTLPGMNSAPEYAWLATREYYAPLALAFHKLFGHSHRTTVLNDNSEVTPRNFSKPQREDRKEAHPFVSIMSNPASGNVFGPRHLLRILPDLQTNSMLKGKDVINIARVYALFKQVMDIIPVEPMSRAEFRVLAEANPQIASDQIDILYDAITLPVFPIKRDANSSDSTITQTGDVIYAPGTTKSEVGVTRDFQIRDYEYLNTFLHEVETTLNSSVEEISAKLRALSEDDDDEPLEKPYDFVFSSLGYALRTYLADAFEDSDQVEAMANEILGILKSGAIAELRKQAVSDPEKWQKVLPALQAIGINL